jgi:rhodanese-related sulfurtransferase
MESIKSNVCRAEDQSFGEQLPEAPDAGAPDFSCAITYTQLTERLRSGRLHIVDVRSPSLFNDFHIDGALNIAAGELHAKAYLQQSPLVLTGSGKNDVQLYRLCRRLHDAGFKSVSVLQGGMLIWGAKGGSVLGQPPAVAPSRQLSAQELLLEKEFAHNHFVLMPEMLSLRNQFPPASVQAQIRGKGLPEAVLRSVKARHQRASAIIMIGSNALAFHSQADALQKQTDIPVLVFVDGKNAVKEAEAAQRAIIASRSRPPRPQQCSQ